MDNGFELLQRTRVFNERKKKSVCEKNAMKNIRPKIPCMFSILFALNLVIISNNSRRFFYQVRKRGLFLSPSILLCARVYLCMLASVFYVFGRQAGRQANKISISTK